MGARQAFAQLQTSPGSSGNAVQPDILSTPHSIQSLQQLANTLVPCNLIKLWMVNQNVTHDQTGSVSRPVLSLLNGHKSNGELECEDSISKPTGDEARQ